jgi:hypothetical protein
MTTIAYCHRDKEIAWDSRSCSGGVISSDSDQKHAKVSGVDFWISGAVCDEQLLIDMYFGHESKLIPESNAIVYDCGEVYMIGVNEDCVLWKQPLRYDKAIGSGGNFALSAMRLGMSAKDAVKHAKRIDCYTGGKVHSMKLKSK